MHAAGACGQAFPCKHCQQTHLRQDIEQSGHAFFCYRAVCTAHLRVCLPSPHISMSLVLVSTFRQNAAGAFSRPPFHVP